MARRKVKNGEKSPWGQCLTRPVPNGRRRSGFWLVPEKHKFSGTNQKPERRRQFGTGLVRHCPQGLFSPFFSFLRAIFSRSFRLSLAPTICPFSPGCYPKTIELTCTWPDRVPWKPAIYAPVVSANKIFSVNRKRYFIALVIVLFLSWHVHKPLNDWSHCCHWDQH